MLDVKPEKYVKFKSSLTKEFYDDVIEKVQNKPAYIELRKKIRDQALISCFSAGYKDYMWEKYAQNAEGICLLYSLQELVINCSSDLKFYPVRYVDDRRNHKEIWFNSKEYNMEDDPEPEHLKFIVSCLTKEKEPYRKEAEWRLFCDYSSIDEEEKGKKFPFVIKPKAIIMGKNIDKNLSFKARVEKYAKQENICLLGQEDIRN